MRIADFALERFFARWEFAAKHLLCASDVQAYPMAELLALADDEMRRLWNGLELGYTESTGHPLLRREIASLYETVQPDEVLTFAGAEEAVFCLMNVLCGPGDHAIVTWPGYQSLYEVARAAGADVTLHELQETHGWALDLDLLRGQVTPATRLIVVNAPHNPTGMLPDRPTYAALVAIATEAGAYLLVDEVYRGLEFEETDRLPAGVDSPLGISLGVMSKAYATAGLRIGWLATHDRDLLARIAAFKDYTTICSSGPSEILAIIALRARDRVLARSRTIVAANLDLLDAFFDEWADRFTWVRPRAGSIGYPRLTVPGVRIDDWAAELVEAEGVLLLPGSQFGHGGNHFRLGFGRTDLPEALERLEAFAGEDPQMTIPARLGIVTLGVADVARSVAFYEALGWERCASSSAEIAWFRTADTHIGLFPWHELAEDARLPAEPRARFGGITLAINVDAAEDVATFLDAVVAAGGTLLKPATVMDWGGTSGYAADPDGHPWEIAHNPHFPIDAEGRVRIP